MVRSLVVGPSLALLLLACACASGVDDDGAASLTTATGPGATATSAGAGGGSTGTTGGDASAGETAPATTTTAASAGETDTGETDAGETDTGEPPAAGERPVIYQLVVRHFGNHNQTRKTGGTLAENGVGTFADVDEAAIAGLLELGITHVWLTGVLRQATLTDYADLGMPADDPDIVKGLAGSFYAIRDYYDVCPDYAVDPAARMAEFEALVDRLHAAGLRVLIDLVPNHVARSYASVVEPAADFGAGDDQGAFFSPDNNYFYLTGQALTLSRPDHYDPPGFTFDGAFPPEDGSPGRAARVTGNDQTSASPAATDWYETVKLNWGYDFTDGAAAYDPIPDTWTKVDAIIAFWQARGVDGFRCDFAHLVPHPAWSWLIDGARARDPGVFFVAEAYADLDGLLDAGFDAVYFDDAYDQLKRIYQGKASQADYAALLNTLSDERRGRYLMYLENHDERRIASPLVLHGGADDSGFGAKEAGYQLAPLAYLYNSGPILFYNGQEVGEPGSGVEGFGQEDGRTSIFDYWSLPELSKWTHGGAYDGGDLAADQAALRAFYADLLALGQDPSARGSGYWGLEYFNNQATFSDCPDGLYSFARYQPGAGRALVVVANFAPASDLSGAIRLPPELLAAIGLRGEVTVRRVLDGGGAADQVAATLDAAALATAGFPVAIPDQRTHVFVIE